MEKRPPSCPPVGYVLTKESGKLLAVPSGQAGNVAALFASAAKGDASLRSLLEIAHATGLRSRSGKPLGVSSLWGVLTNPFYVGMVRCGDRVLPGSHQALISAETFEGVQVVLRARRANARSVHQVQG